MVVRRMAAVGMGVIPVVVVIRRIFVGMLRASLGGGVG